MISLTLSKKDLRRIYYVDLLVSKFYKCSLYEFCSKYKYDALFVDIIKNVTMDYNYDRVGMLDINLDDALDDRYYEVEKKFSYGIDNRNVVERVVSLGVNWVIEDVIVHKSSSVFILTGCDNARDLLVNPITNTPDIRYVGKGESFYVEVCSDFTNFMQKNRRYDIRKLKYYKLEDLKKIDRTETLLLFVDVVNKSYYCSWFVSRDFTFYDKYVKNTVAFEFNEQAKFKELKELFEFCKSCQENPSLYSNFNVDENEKKVIRNKNVVDDYDCDEYWESLFKSEPAYVRNITEEEFLSSSVYREYEDPDAEGREAFYNENFDRIAQEEPKFTELEPISDAEINDIFGSNPFDNPFDELPF